MVSFSNVSFPYSVGALEAGDPPSQQVEPMEVEQEPIQQETRKRERNEIAESQTPEEDYLSPPEEKRARAESDDSMGIRESVFIEQEVSCFGGVLGILSDTKIFFLYQRAFGNRLCVNPKAIKERERFIKESKIIQLADIDSMIQRAYHQLLLIQSGWNALPAELRGKFGNIDSSKILNSVESCTSALLAILDWNLRILGIRIYQEFIPYESSHDLNVNANEMNAKLERQRNEFTELDLCDAGLTRLPPVVTKFRNLRYLDLSWNPHIGVPEPIVELSELKTLLIAGCAPNEIPSWVFKLRSLTQLDVEGNQIKFLPRELEELTLLTDLDISHNPITTIFFDVDKMRYLQSVYISIDQFTMLPFLFLSKVGAKLKIVDGKGQPIKKYRL